MLVVGAGNSGCDLAVDAAQSGRDISVSVRSGLMFQPKTLFGRPRSELPLLGRLPIGAAGAGVAGADRRLARHPRALRPARARHPQPAPQPAGGQRPAVALHPSRPCPRGAGHRALRGPDVHFTRRNAREFDTIVFATGFKVTLPFLDPALLQWADGVPLRVAGMTVPVGLERLYFVGLAAPRGPQLPVYSAQARLIAKLLRRARRAARRRFDRLAPRRGSTSRATSGSATWTARTGAPTGCAARRDAPGA